MWKAHSDSYDPQDPEPIQIFRIALLIDRRDKVLCVVVGTMKDTQRAQ